MNLPPLLILVLVEAGILALLFLALLAWPAADALARRRRRREEALARRLEAAVAAASPDGGAGAGAVPAAVGAETATPAPDRDELVDAVAGCSIPTILRVLESAGIVDPSTRDDGGRPPRGATSLERLFAEAGLYARLARRARSPFWWRRQDAARLLGPAGRPEDVPLLHLLLEDRHPAVSDAALLAASRLRDPTLLPVLLDRAMDSGTGSPRQRELVLSVIVDFGDRAAELVARRLASANQPERERILLRLAGRLGHPSLRDRVLDRLRRGGFEARINAARALIGFPGGETVQALRRALDDPAWQTRAQAASSLGALGAEEAVDDLANSLRDPSWWVRLRSALALRRLGRAGVERLRSTSPSADAYAHDMAVYVLRLDRAAVAEHRT